MRDHSTGGADLHWDSAYLNRPETELSWFEPQAAMSMSLLDKLEMPLSSSVVDVGGGASMFADGLVGRGFADITVLDLSARALAIARRRLEREPRIIWIEQDVLTWVPGRRYDVWHDRAVLHFLTGETDRQRYLRVLKAATLPGSGVIIGAFSLDGPQYCSGLPVHRYSTQTLAELLGPSFVPVFSTTAEHHTPAGVVQPFSWLAAKRLAG